MYDIDFELAIEKMKSIREELKNKKVDSIEANKVFLKAKDNYQEWLRRVNK
jgi:hypothetical protein